MVEFRIHGDTRPYLYQGINGRFGGLIVVGVNDNTLLVIILVRMFCCYNIVVDEFLRRTLITIYNRHFDLFTSGSWTSFDVQCVIITVATGFREHSDIIRTGTVVVMHRFL